MRVTVTGATGLIGRTLVRRLRERGDDVTVLTRDAAKARERLGDDISAVVWDPDGGPAPSAALAGRDGVVHLAGENLAQRWTRAAKRRIVASRDLGTRNLVTGMSAADPRPRVLVSSSGVGYYGPRGDEPLAEDAPAGDDFLAGVVAVWEREADRATEAGVRVVKLRTGVVLDAHGGALSKMLPAFKAGVGGPVAGGRQFLAWIHLDDIVSMIVEALDDDRWSGAINATAPQPTSNADFSKALGRALHRPAVAPVPALAMRALYGEMADLIVYGQRAVPRRALELGFSFRHPGLDEALRSAVRK